MPLKPIDSTEFHKLIHAEETYLAGIMLDESQVVGTKITLDHFRTDKNKKIFGTIMTAISKGETVDIFSMKHKLEGWVTQPGEIDKWAESVFNAGFAQSPEDILDRDFQEREIRNISYDLSNDFDAEKAIKRLKKHEKPIEEKYTYSISEGLALAVNEAERSALADGIVGLRTGLVKIDEALTGFRDSDFYVIGARTGVGKTVMMVNFALANECPVLIFSAEQPVTQIGLRILSADGGISAKHLRTGKLEQHENSALVATVQKFAEYPLYIHDQPSLSIGDLERKARQMKDKYDIKIFYVDYLQLIKSPGADGRRLEVADIATRLKALARELQIPGVALAQLNRNADKDGKIRKPQLSDLSESGEIEQSADVVMLLYRDEVYNPQTKDKGIMEIDIKKNRHGVTGKFYAAWIGEKMQIRDLAVGRNTPDTIH